VRMNPTTVQNVVTYDTIIDFDNPDLKLFPGMTGYVSIPVSSVLGVDAVPNAALRFKPDLDQKKLAGICGQYGVTGGTCGKGQGAGTGGGGGTGQGGGSGRGGALAPDEAIVWKLRDDNSLEPVKVAMGITDHNFTQVVRGVQGEIKAGDRVVTAGAARVKPAAGPGAGPGGGAGRR
jgi:HlyD family secretion protein